jgi:hypothetical protein
MNRVRTRRSATEWSIRAALALLAAIAGYMCLVDTAAYWLRTGDPERAHRLAPGDGRITAALAASLVTANVTALNGHRAATLARAALQREPTAVAALSTLGLTAGVRGDLKAARGAFALAERLSRRDLQTQLWLIEDDVGRGNISGALMHYDTALRTSRNAPDLLFPVLATAIADPAVRRATAGILARRPAWGDSFVGYLAGNSTNPRAAAQLFLSLRQADVTVPQQASTLTINSLIARGLIDDAWAYYARIRAGADRRSARDPHFDPAIVAPSLLDWVPINDGGITTSIQRGDRGGVFGFDVPAGPGGPLLQQIQLLPAGAYRLTGRGNTNDQSGKTRPYWLLRCQASGRDIGRVDMGSAGEARFDGVFSVPADCPVQFLILMAQPADGASSMSGQIDEVRLVPAGR